ncbi:MAG: family 1 encapsulin nanocompartment shell protein [Eggerthellaceae bacterium]
MTNTELMQALRIDIAGELEAIFLYDAHYQATDDPAAKAVLADIRDEEKAHMGELITLMRHLDPTETEFFLEGEGEVQEKLAELGIKTDGEIAPARGARSRPHRRRPFLTQPTSGAQPPTNVSRATFVRAAAFSRKESLMDYLARESADLSDGLWNRIDETAIGTARAQLTCRRFLKVFGPLGAGVTTVAVDGVNKEEVLEDGIGRIVGRTQLELPLFYEDFTLLSRDMEYAAQTGYPLDLSVAIAAAKKASRREDDLILNGSKALGTDGLLTVKGSSKIKKSDWSRARTASPTWPPPCRSAKAGYLGRYALAVAPDLFLALQRLQPNTGMLEIERIKKLIGDNVYLTSALDSGKAVLVCAEPEYLDLALGLDLSVGYLELADFNHTFRIMETAALRIKDPGAIVTFA